MTGEDHGNAIEDTPLLPGDRNNFLERSRENPFALREDYKTFLWLFVKDFLPILAVFVFSIMLWADPEWLVLDAFSVVFVCIFMLFDTLQLLVDFYCSNQLPDSGFGSPAGYERILMKAQ